MTPAELSIPPHDCTSSCLEHCTIIGWSCHKHLFFLFSFCCDKTRLLSRQKYACRDKHISVAIKRNFCVCRDKLTFVATNTCFSRQNTSFVATKACLSRQIVCVCRDKYLFVATKMTLAAAPANDTAREELSYRSAMLLVKDRVVRQKGRRFVVCCIQPSSDS